ncbi:MAG: DUF5667 domain-containing protein [Chloroflexota bacterium]
MNNLYDILEVCLEELDNGVGLEDILARYPDKVAELRPMLQAAFIAQQESVPAPSQNVVMRNQAKVLQRFDQVWDAKPASRSRFPSLQWRMVGFALLLIMFFLSGTNLVRASFDSLPGDSLYPVKLSWEKTTLLFTFDAHTRQDLQLKYNDERLKEVTQLFASGRTSHVEFVGVVTLQRDEAWQVANIPVIVSAQTDLPVRVIQSGDLVRVIGVTRGDGFVLAERIELVTVGALVPTQLSVETEQPLTTPQPENENINFGSETETPIVHGTETATPTLAPKIESFEGILIAIDQTVWKIDAVIVEAGQAEIKGVPVIGATVKAEGYFGPDGIFVATKLEIISKGSNDNNSNSNNSTNGNININDNTNTDGNSNSTDDNGGNGNGGGGSNDNGGGHGGNGG